MEIENKTDFVTTALEDGWTSSDIRWVEENYNLPAETFFTQAHELIKQGASIKKIKTECDIPFVYDEDKNGNLIRGYEGTITDEPPVPIALTPTKEGKPQRTIENFLEVFRHDPHYDKIRYNTLSNRAEYYGFNEDKGVPEWLPWDDTAEAESRHYCENTWGIYAKDRHDDAMRILWKERRVNPVREMIQALPAWDGQERCAYFLQSWLMVDDSLYTRAVGQILFDSAVSRAFSAGCKFDTAIVFVGEKTGEGKSEMVRFLNMQDEFYREIKDIGADPDKVIEDMLGGWVIEIGEYMMVGTPRTVEQTKQFLSRKEDRYRVKYNRHVDTLPRKCVFIATTNHREFLTDSTAERKWLPVLVHSDADFVRNSEKAAELREFIKLCYAEAYHHFKNGCAMTFIPDELLPEAKTHQSLATVEDDRVGIVEQYCAEQLQQGKIFVYGLEIWREALHLAPEKYTGNKAATRDIKELLRKIPCLTEGVRGSIDYPETQYTETDGKQRVFWITENPLKVQTP